jgi:hypothetical protein
MGLNSSRRHERYQGRSPVKYLVIVDVGQIAIAIALILELLK